MYARSPNPNGVLYPVPVPDTTSTACYPSQFISSYFSAQDVTTPLPAPSPLVCPVGYGTILSTTVSSSEYVACCPSSFLLARPTGSSVTDRPAYGGTCYSDISTIIVTTYNNTSTIATSTWVTSVSGAQAYALVMDGYAAASATSGNGIFASSTSSPSVMFTSTGPASTTTVFLASSTSNPSSSSSSSSGLSGGAIAGIVIGCVAGAILLLAVFFFFFFFFFFFLRRRRQASRTNAPEIDSSTTGLANVEMEGDTAAAGFDDKDAKVLPYAQQAKTDSHTGLPGYEAAHEVESPMNRPVEMQGEGVVDGGSADSTAGPHEMAVES